MPIYQYKCSQCGHRFEALQKMSDARLTDCPECETPNLVKQITSAAFKLKGSGWYETDFKNSGAKPTADKTQNSTNSNASEGQSKDLQSSNKDKKSTGSADSTSSAIEA